MTEITETVDLNDADLDRIQGGWSWGETNSGTFAKNDPKGIIPETPIPAGRGLKAGHDAVMHDLKKDNITAPEGHV